MISDGKEQYFTTGTFSGHVWSRICDLLQIPRVSMYQRIVLRHFGVISLAVSLSIALVIELYAVFKLASEHATEKKPLYFCLNTLQTTSVS